MLLLSTSTDVALWVFFLDGGAGVVGNFWANWIGQLVEGSFESIYLDSAERHLKCV